MYANSVSTLSKSTDMSRCMWRNASDDSGSCPVVSWCSPCPTMHAVGAAHLHWFRIHNKSLAVGMQSDEVLKCSGNQYDCMHSLKAWLHESGRLSARVYFSVQLITICAVVNLKCAPEKAPCAVVICAVVKYLPK